MKKILIIAIVVLAVTNVLNAGLTPGWNIEKNFLNEGLAIPMYWDEEYQSVTSKDGRLVIYLNQPSFINDRGTYPINIHPDQLGWSVISMGYINAEILLYELLIPAREDIGPSGEKVFFLLGFEEPERTYGVQGRFLKFKVVPNKEQPSDTTTSDLSLRILKL